MNSKEPDIERNAPSMKMRVARTLKWNTIDKLLTQILYAVTGVVLARILSQEDFGLVGAVLVFQAFAVMFVDSGFSYALIQRKHPTDLDYSTVLWFNVGVASLLYIVLFIGAPLIAMCFQDDQRIIPLSRVMTLTFIINAASVVQINRLTKQMNVKFVTISNSVGLAVGAVVGICLAIAGYGAWALVWQSVANSAVRTIIIWVASRWRPMMSFSWAVLKSYFRIGSSMMGTAFLNTLFQNIYSFFIGNRVGIIPLGYYTQADKWSKMGVTSFTAIFTQSFLPALSEYQDSPTQFAAATAKMNRLTAYILFPVFFMLIAYATEIFHLLFGTKWDAAIILFRLLLLRGIFTIITSLYSNYVLARGRAKLVVTTELWRDLIAIGAIVATLPFIALSTPENYTMGIAIFLWGQVFAAVVGWIIMLCVTARLAWRTPLMFVKDAVPYLLMAATAVGLSLPIVCLTDNPWLSLPSMALIAAVIYLSVNAILRSKVQDDVMGYLKLNRFVRS